MHIDVVHVYKPLFAYRFCVFPLIGKHYQIHTAWSRLISDKPSLPPNNIPICFVPIQKTDADTIRIG